MAKEPLLDTRPPGWEYGTGRGNKAQKVCTAPVSKEAYVYGKRDLRIWQKSHTSTGRGSRRRGGCPRVRPQCASVLSLKETCVYGKRSLRVFQKRPAYMATRDLCIWQKRPMYMAKETYVHGKRDLCIWQKKPACIPKETCVYGNKRLTCILTLQKRPAYIAKETCLYCKRDLLTLAAGVGGRPRVSRSFEWGKEALLQSKRLTNTIVIGRCNNL